MTKRITIKAGIITLACAGLVAAQTFAQKEHQHMKPTNLKVLPKDISEDSLHTVMREYSMALGVHCNYCHAQAADAVPGQEHPKMDFASDAKPEKDIARDMMRMTADINSKYIVKMSDHHLDQIGCVTCHNGSAHPITSVDSLKRKM